MTTSYQKQAKQIVRKYVEQVLDKSDPKPAYEVYVVWFCKTLQNWKALVSTSLIDSMYYEVMYNGDKNEAYLDVYRKIGNFVIKDRDDSVNHSCD